MPILFCCESVPNLSILYNVNINNNLIKGR